MNILVLNHSLDDVMRRLFGDISERSGYHVYISGPGESSRKEYGKCEGIESPPIKSKITPRAIAALRRTIKERRINIVYAPSTSGLSNALIASLGTKARCVGYRGTQHRIHRSDPSNYLALLNPRVAHISCETADIYENLQNYVPASRLSWKSKPFHLDWAAEALAEPAPTAPEVSRAALRLIFVGVAKGRPYKGLSVLIEAMHLLKDLDVALTVVGEAGDSDIKAAPPSVVFTGNRSDAMNLMASHNIFVLPSLRDASPRVLREAQACGLPCIVSDIPGARDLIVAGQSGFLVAPGSAEAIAEAVRKFASDSALTKAMGEKAKRNIAENFAPEAFTEYYINLFNSL